eukprot:scaffold253049_cov93-Cyclotella_meneghiniana.AAC.1
MDMVDEHGAAKRIKSSPENNTEETPYEFPLLLCNPTFITKYISFYVSYKPQKAKTKNLPSEILTARRSIQHCCRDNDLPKGIQVLQRAIVECVYIEPQSFYNVLNLCEGSSFGKVHVGTPKPRNEKADKTNNAQDGINHNQDPNLDGNEVEPNEEISLSRRLMYANEIHSLMSKLHIPCTEPTYTALIRLASRVGDFDRAERYLEDAERTQQCKGKLRMYSALIRGYCGDYFHGTATNKEESVTKERLSKALKVWVRMYNHSGSNVNLFGEGISPKIQLSEVEYASLIKAATALHDHAVMERLLSDLAERVLVPGLNTTESILNWFSSDGNSNVGYGASSTLEGITLPPRDGSSIGNVCNENGRGWKIFNGCSIDSSTGHLTLNNVEDGEFSSMIGTLKLKPVELADNAWSEMRRMNSKIVLDGQVEGHVSQYQGGGKGKKRPRGSNETTSKNGNNDKQGSYRMNKWQQFESFLSSHPPYNYVIDGANVGYFQQNFNNAPKHVDYEQIDWLIRHLFESDRNKHIILFLHERHFSSNLCPKWAFNLIEAWDGNESPYDKLTVYRTPAGMNDDWYWMHAALMPVGNSRAESGPILAITNDEMRDHHFQMLAQGSFLRWKERHQVHFDFGGYNEDRRRREVLLQYPSLYSRRIQMIKGSNGSDAIVVPLPKRGDEGRYVDGCHVADDSAPEEETYAVICKVI